MDRWPDTSVQEQRGKSARRNAVPRRAAIVENVKRDGGERARAQVGSRAVAVCQRVRSARELQRELACIHACCCDVSVGTVRWKVATGSTL